MPGLLEIAAMVDGNAIEPGAPGGIAAELIHLAESLEKNVVRGVLGLLRIAQKAQGKVINRAAVRGVKVGKFRRRQTGLRFIQTLTFCDRAVHESTHNVLDSKAGAKSRRQMRAKRV